MAQERLRRATLHPRSEAAAERSYPRSEVSGSVRGQGRRPGGDSPSPRSGRRPGGATLRLRPVAVRRRHPESEIRGSQEKPPATSRWRPGAVTLRSHPEPEARGGNWEEPPTPKARTSGSGEQPEERWLRRCRRAYRSYPTLKVRKVAVWRYPSSKVRSSGFALLEQR